jgi:hypothetical protein
MAAQATRAANRLRGCHPAASEVIAGLSTDGRMIVESRLVRADD